MSKRISELNLFFSTPVWVSRINDHKIINENIIVYIKKLQSEDPKGIQK